MTKKVLYYVISALAVLLLGLGTWYGVAYSDKADTDSVQDTTLVASPVLGVEFYDVARTYTLDVQHFAASENSSFVKSELVLDQYVDDVEGDVHVVSMTNYFIVDGVMNTVTHPATAVGKVAKSVYNTTDEVIVGLGTIKLPVSMDVNGLIDVLNRVNTTKPHTKNVVLTCPLTQNPVPVYTVGELTVNTVDSTVQ